MDAKKILLIDDDPDILEAMQAMLEDEGYAVVTADAHDYIEKIFKDGSLPNLILIDILLSGKDGREIVQELKSQQDTQHIPIIMTSARSSVEKTARESGADDFLAKPFDIDDLLDMVAKHL